MRKEGFSCSRLKNQKQGGAVIRFSFAEEQKIQKVGCAKKENEIGLGVWPWLVFLFFLNVSKLTPPSSSPFFLLLVAIYAI